jgi:hypothetical protein
MSLNLQINYELKFDKTKLYKMKNLKYSIPVFFTLIVMFISCQDDDATFGEVIAPTNLVLSAEIVGVDSNNPNGDGSGFVNFTTSSDNTITYRYNFGDNSGNVVAPSGNITHRFNKTGLNSYTVSVIASGKGGISSSTSIIVEVFSSFDDQEAKDFLSGGKGSSKTWFLAASEVGHLGVGGTSEISPDAFWWPSFFAAQPFEKCNDDISDCLCDDELTFTLDENNQLTYQLNNNGQTFFNAAHQGIIGENAGEDACFDFDTSGTSFVSLAPTTEDWSQVPDPDFNPRGTVMNFTNDAFMGYFVSSSSYEILEITENSLYVRTIDGLNPVLAWYHRFSTSPAVETFTSEFNDLVWQDEFDVNGAPNSANWDYDLGGGGWGNGEEQTYTNDPSNVIVEDGILKITAKAEGGSFTSTRMKSEKLFEFSYGRVEVRAKLPASAGTWPAIWMLGANFDTVGWPESGEIDIMEQSGGDKNTVLGTLHFPDNSGGNGIGDSTNISTATTEFHNYTLEWTPNVIKILVDDSVYFSFANTNTTPFNADFFLILNVAMGGTLGGAIDPGFTQDSMEIDYIRVFQ